MDRTQGSAVPRAVRDVSHAHPDGHNDRRSFLNAAGKFAAGALTTGSIANMIRPNHVWAHQVANMTHPASARLIDRLRTRFTFQISVDVATLDQGLGVA